MMLPTLRRMGFPIGHIRLPRRGDERVRRVLLLMLPVSIGLGLININLLLNTVIGSGVSDEVPRAIDAAFRIYMLPQGMFSVAVATVLFPQLARLAARDDYAGMRATIGTGMRQIGLLLIPAGAAMAVLAEPLVRLVFERGEWDAESTALTADALFWFAFSLPFSGWVLMLTRGFFSLQQPLTPTKLAVGSLAINAVGSYLLAKPFGIAGIVLGTIASNVALVLAEAVLLRRALGGFETRETLRRGREDARRGGRPGGRELRRLVRPGRAARGLADRADRERLHRPGRSDRWPTPASFWDSRSPKRGKSSTSSREDCAVAPNLRGLWPTSSTSATSRSSPTSTMASRRWPIGSSSSPTPSTPGRCVPSCSIRWTWNASAGSRSRRRPCASSTRRRTARPTSST